MFGEEGKGQVKTDELEQLMSFLGINSTKSELASTVKDVDRVSEADRDSWGRQGSPVHDEGCATLTGRLFPRERVLQLQQLPGPDGGCIGRRPRTKRVS